MRPVNLNEEGLAFPAVAGALAAIGKLPLWWCMACPAVGATTPTTTELPLSLAARRLLAA